MMTTTTVNSATQPPVLRIPPSIGNWPLGVLPEFRRDPLGLYLRALQQYRDVVRLRFGPRFSYTLFHPDFIKRVLVDNNRNYQRHALSNSLLKLLTGDNLLTGDGDFWLRQRRLIQPAFHRQRLSGFGNIITYSAAQMLADWEQQPSGQSLDIAAAMHQVTLRIVGLALFSVDLLKEGHILSHSITVSSEYFAYRIGRLLAPPLWFPTQRNREFKRARQQALQIVPDLIATRRKLIAQTGAAEESGRPYDMIDLLLDARYEETGQPMDDEQMSREIRMFIGAGHETTANTLTWTLYLLSQHPAVEAKLHVEVDNVLQGRTPTIADMPRLPYTLMVIQEAMRLYPAAWVVARQSIGEDQLGDYLMLENQGVTIPIYAVHRHPDYWVEPEQFDPERFSPARAESHHKFAYLPFGGGPRLCIGNQFALTEAQLILSMIAQQYQLRLQPGFQVTPEPLITLRVRGGLPMTVERRG
jgi:cytochrome P450